MGFWERKRRTDPAAIASLPLVEDPNHPALKGQYAAGEVHRINYHREHRGPWEAVEVLLTLRCTIACTHCITNSHPERAEVMNKDLLLALIAALADLGRTRYVCLFGGEPFIEMDLLEAGIRECRHRGLLPSSGTCGFWGETPRQARKVARCLRGLNHLLLSTDRSHRTFIDLDTVIRAAEACVAEGINTSINYVAEAGEFAGADSLPRELTLAARRMGVGIVITPCSDAGRAASNRHLVVSLDPSVPCGKLDVPLFDCEGKAFACGPGWTIPDEGDSRWELGRFPECHLGQLIDRAYGSPVLCSLRRTGPLATARWIARERGAPREIQDPNRPSSPCGTCQRIAGWFPEGSRFALPTASERSLPACNS